MSIATGAADSDICSNVSPPQVNGAVLNDASGWNKPEYYSTLNFADIDGDGQAELIARGPEGIVVQHFGKASSAWFPSAATLPLGDNEGWNRPERYTTIRTADIDGDGRAELIVLEEDGTHAWQFDAQKDRWQEVRSPGLLGNAEVSTPRVPTEDGIPLYGDLDGDGRTERVIRTKDGLLVFQLDPHSNPWTSQWTRVGSTLIDLDDAHGWNRTETRSTLQLVDLDGDGGAELVGRSSEGIEVWHWNATALAFEKVTAGPGFPPFTGDKLTAYQFISGQLLAGASNADIRSQYSNEALAQNFTDAYPAKLKSLSAPGGVTASDWASVVNELLTEFSYVGDVNNWFNLHQNFINELNNSNILSVSTVAGKLRFPSDGSRNGNNVALNVLTFIANAVSGIGSITGQPEVAGIAKLFSTVFTASAAFSGQNQSQPNINATVVGLQDKLNTQFVNAIAANGCLKADYLQSLTLLESLGLPIAQGKYKWDDTLDGKMLAAGRYAYEVSLWKALTPVIWEIGSQPGICLGDSCSPPEVVQDPPYPGNYYYLDFEGDENGQGYADCFYVKLKGVDYHGGWQPAKATLDALFQPAPNGLGISLYDVIGANPDSDWTLSGDTPP